MTSKSPGETAPTLPWGAPLVHGTLVRRYHRFLADVLLTEGPRAGETVVAHCVNSGRMEGLVRKGCPVWLSPASNPKRALRFTWEMSELDGVRVGTNTALPNALVGALLEKRALAGFEKHKGFVAEKPYGENSRVDFAVAMTKKSEHLIEVKNCHLVYPDGGGYWPDSVSVRGTKHLHELARVVREGGSATVLFIVQRSDVRFVRPSDVHDPAFAESARAAASDGVRFRALRVEPGALGLRVIDEVPVDLARYELEPARRWAAALAKESGWERPPAKKKPAKVAPRSAETARPAVPSRARKRVEGA